MRRVVLGGFMSAVAITQPGCVAWRPQTAPAAQILSSNKVDVIRVTKPDSSKVIVYAPKMVGDTITGHPSPTAILRLALAPGEVASVSTRYRHIGKTLLAGIAIIGGVAIYGLLQTLNQSP